MLEEIRRAIQPLRVSLLEHPLYRELRGIAALRTFMEYHVFAVWDFMSLLKSLQRRLCCIDVPWLPPSDSESCRLINEIVLGEESDEDGRGGHISHFGLYHGSMKQFGASTSQIDLFMSGLGTGATLPQAFEAASIPESIRKFVLQTFSIIDKNHSCAIAAAFTFGREDLLPDVFQKIVSELSAQSNGRLQLFEYYLRRHMQLDSDEHGPKAAQLISTLCGDQPENWQAAKTAAVESLQARLTLWNAIHHAIQE